MSKKLHLKLNKAWKLCLEQRKWICEQLNAGSNENPHNLKYDWFEKFGKGERPPACCYFCEYDGQFKADCTHCPIKLVSPRCNCENTGFNYDDNPHKFYARLLRFDKRRRGK